MKYPLGFARRAAIIQVESRMDTRGRERRRKGVVNRLRRAFYALVMFAAPPYAMAIDELAYYGQVRAPETRPAAPKPGWVAAQTTVAFNAKILGLADLVARGTLAPQPAVGEAIERSLDVAPSEDRFLVTVVTDDLRLIRNGVALELAVQSVGHFHLNLQPRQLSREPGKRLSLLLPEEGATEPGAWSLGAALAPTRTHDGRRAPALIPQVLLDLDRLSDGALPAEAAIQYANWGGASGKDVSSDKVFQATFRWRF